MEKVTETLEIDGMTCGGCMHIVRTALGAIEGVEIKEMTLSTAEVAYDSADVSHDVIVEAIRGQGFDVR